MNWSNIASSAVVGGVIGGLLGIPMVGAKFTKNKPVVVRDAQAHGYSVVAIKMSWFYAGMYLRYHVVLHDGAQTVRAIAQVYRNQRVTWTPPLPPTLPPPESPAPAQDANHLLAN